MSNGPPCAKGLTQKCFQAHPQFARQAFAYRLLHTIAPGEITRRLPKGLFRALIGPGAVVPDSTTLPPGTVVSPGVTIPVGYQPGDPIPPGTYTPPPQPPTSGVAAPSHLDLTPGATTQGKSSTTLIATGYFFEERFATYPGTFWTDVSTGTCTTELDGDKLRLHDTTGTARTQGTISDPYPTNYDIEIEVYPATLASGMAIDFYTGTHEIDIQLNTTFGWWAMNTSAGTRIIETFTIVGHTHVFKIENRNGALTVYRNGDQKDTGFTAANSTSTPGRIDIQAAANCSVFIDDILITSYD